MSKLTEKVTLLRSCLEECSQPIKTEIVGVIPNWLKGTLLRNGPGLQQIGADKYKHMFDGLALMHRFVINNGQVQYQNKFLRSDAYKSNIKANRIVVTEFGTRAFPDPCKSIWQRFMAYFSPKMTDNDSVNIYPIGDQLYAATETNFIHRIDPNSLNTHEKIDLSKYLAVNTATAHAHYDDKNVYNFGSSFGPFGKYSLIKIPNSDKPFEKSSIICSIKIERPLYPSYYHSFSMTENYFIFIEQPLVISVPSLAFSKISGKSYSDCLEWKPNLSTRFYVIRRKDGQILNTKYLSEPFMFFHTINAFEENNQIVIDLCGYSDNKIIKALSEEGFKAVLEDKAKYGAISEVRRYVLPLVEYFENMKFNENIVNLNNCTASASANHSDSSIKLKHESLTPSGPGMGELPRINYKFNGKKYRYFYSLAQSEELQTKLMKFDINTKQSIIWEEQYAIPSEPVFVENPNLCDDCEDEGVVLSAVLSELDETKGFLLVLDAKTFKELGRAEFRSNSSVPGTFHGIFVP